jgi:Uncharacterized protein conserved in bacteria
MRITCDPAKRRQSLQERGLDMRRAGEVFAGLHLTRLDDRFDYGETRYVTAGWLDSTCGVRLDAARFGPQDHQHEALP